MIQGKKKTLDHELPIKVMLPDEQHCRQRNDCSKSARRNKQENPS